MLVSIYSGSAFSAAPLASFLSSYSSINLIINLQKTSFDFSAVVRAHRIGMSTSLLTQWPLLTFYLLPLVSRLPLSLYLGRNGTLFLVSPMPITRQRARTPRCWLSKSLSHSALFYFLELACVLFFRRWKELRPYAPKGEKGRYLRGWKVRSVRPSEASRKAFATRFKRQSQQKAALVPGPAGNSSAAQPAVDPRRPRDLTTPRSASTFTAADSRAADSRAAENRVGKANRQESMLQSGITPSRNQWEAALVRGTAGDSSAARPTIDPGLPQPSAAKTQGQASTFTAAAFRAAENRSAVDPALSQSPFTVYRRPLPPAAENQEGTTQTRASSSAPLRRENRPAMFERDFEEQQLTSLKGKESTEGMDSFRPKKSRTPNYGSVREQRGGSLPE